MANASHEATLIQGNLLQSLPKDSSLILDRITPTTPDQETPPPQITAVSKPKPDSGGSTPLHLAAASGNVVSLDPVHVAGRMSVLKEAARGVIVECCRFEARKVVVDSVGFQFQEFVNTALHLAVADKQTQTIEYHLNHNLIETLRPQNDVVLLPQILQNHAAAQPVIPNPRPPQSQSNQSDHHPPPPEKHDDWIERQRDALMVVASLLASMGFTAGVAPPAGVLQVQREPTVWSYYSRFLVYNTVSFMSSISIILLLVSGVPFRRRAFMWILMAVVWVAVASTACTYAVAVEHHLQYKDVPVIRSVFGFGLLTWVFVMAVVVGFHVSRVYVMVVGKFRKRGRVYGREVGMQAV